jgi:hypothetical protein
MVHLPWKYAFAYVHDHVMAYISTFEVATMLFSRGDDIHDAEDVPFTDSQEGTSIDTEFILVVGKTLLITTYG